MRETQAAPLDKSFENAGFAAEDTGGGCLVYHCDGHYVADQGGEGLPQAGKPVTWWVETTDGDREREGESPTPEDFLRDWGYEAR